MLVPFLLRNACWFIVVIKRSNAITVGVGVCHANVGMNVAAVSALRVVPLVLYWLCG